jgi:hypothetical protein
MFRGGFVKVKYQLEAARSLSISSAQCICPSLIVTGAGTQTSIQIRAHIALERSL